MLNVPAYLWAKIVKELDNNKCVVCGSKERLEAHHIKSKSEYPELSNALENGVTLCRSCHYSAHEGHFVKKGMAMRKFLISPEIVNNTMHEYQESRIILQIPKGRKAKLQAYATEQGESLNGFVNRAIDEAMERDGKNK